MRLVIQRVLSASISIDGGPKESMGEGLVVLFASSLDDGMPSDEAISKLASKTAKMRIFNDGDGKMNLSAEQLGFGIMAVPNFTLFAETAKGNRPSFSSSGERQHALDAFERYCEELEKYPLAQFIKGKFGSYMKVELINDGPVTIIVDTRDW
jgi:D-tyrosyl-tRNA(Tyr) deacylase